MSEFRVFHKGLSGVRKLYSTSEIWNVAEDQVGSNPDSDFYESIYLYKEEHKQILLNTKSLAGIRDVTTDRIVLDFDYDKKDDSITIDERISLAKADVVSAVQRLQKHFPKESIQVYFSSGKGFHVVVETDQRFDRKQFESFIYYFGDNLNTFDEKIKDQQRLFRFPLTKNKKTGMYKIPLTEEELNGDLALIKKEASEPDFDKRFEMINKYVKTSVPEDLIKLVNKPKEKEKKEVSTVSNGPDLRRKPKHLTAAKYVLQEGYFDEGERNEACMILASTYKFLGYNSEHAFGLLKTTLELRAERLNLGEVDEEQLRHTIINHVYGEHWQGGMYSENENALLQKTIAKYKLVAEDAAQKYVKIEDVGNRFLIFAQNVDQNTVKTGIKEFDENVLITTGMMVGYLGAPSSGKTTTILNILEHQSKNNILSYFQSADMPDVLLYARLISKYCGWEFAKILDTIKMTPAHKWPKELKDAWDQVTYNFRNVGLSFKSGPTIQDIKEGIDDYEQSMGKPVKTFAMDYLEKMRCDINDATAASGYNAARLADLTKDKDMASFLLLQTQKSGGDPSDELLSMRKVKGSSVIEQDSRLILAQWRPGFNPNISGINYDDCYASVAIVKNNMGKTGRMDFKWDGATGKMTSLTPDERKDFERVIKETKERKDGIKAKEKDLY